jgi:hypothetical protein
MTEHNSAPIVPVPPHAVSPHGHAVTGVTRFEGSDARASIVIWTLGIIAATLVGAFALTIGIQKYLDKINPVGEPTSPLAPYRVLPPDPQIEVHPWEDIIELRAHDKEILDGIGKDASGQPYVPIDRAMEEVLPTLKIRPGAPSGAMTQGGEGRTSHGGDVNREPYRIEIKGGAQPNAQ